MKPGDGAASRRVLVLALTARDAEASATVLAQSNVEAVLCDGLASLCAAIEEGAGAVVLAEEAVLADAQESLRQALARQPAWSDLPIIVLARSGVESPAVARALSTLGNVSLLERPARISTLLSLIESALKARERQYQVRDLLAGERAARAEADRANSAKDRFLAVLSHELRTPLSPVLLSISAMEGNRELPDDLRDEVSMIRRNVDLEAKLIDDLLDLSRITSGKLRLNPQPTSVHEVLQHVFLVCAADLEARHLVLVSDLAAGDDRVMADGARLEQVFWNLLKNAIKFTPERGQITVRSRNPQESRLVVEFRDTGVGIPADLLPRVFDAFQQGESQVAWQSGLGLGLAISKAVMDLHEGTITAQSDGDDQGASFSIEIPTLPPGSQPYSRQEGPRWQAAPHQRSPRLLVVEDNADSAEMLAKLLRHFGYEVMTSSTVAQALDTASAHRFDLLLSDIGLPDASGCELMRRIGALYGTPGIAISGYGMEEDVRRSQEAGFLDHVVKPVDFERLKTLVERAVSLPVQRF